ALPGIIAAIKARGYEFATFSELLAAGEPVVSATCYDSRPGDTDRPRHPLPVATSSFGFGWLWHGVASTCRAARPHQVTAASLGSQPSAQIHPMTHRMKVRAALALLALALAATAARGESTPEPAACSAEALGTARVLPIEAATTPRVGRKHFHDTLP